MLRSTTVVVQSKTNPELMSPPRLGLPAPSSGSPSGCPCRRQTGRRRPPAHEWGARMSQVAAVPLLQGQPSSAVGTRRQLQCASVAAAPLPKHPPHPPPPTLFSPPPPNRAAGRMGARRWARGLQDRGAGGVEGPRSVGRTQPTFHRWGAHDNGRASRPPRPTAAAAAPGRTGRVPCRRVRDAWCLFGCRGWCEQQQERRWPQASPHHAAAALPS